MSDRTYPATCLSSFEHGDDVRDVVLHYFGCLRETERDAYFKQLPHHKQDRIYSEGERIRKQREFFESDDRTKGLVREFRTSLNQLPLIRGRVGETLQNSGNPVKLCKENAWGMSAYAIFFRNSERYTDPNCSDHFPNQRLDVKDLLYNKDRETNPLMRSCAKDEIRYFHLPGNNMEWVEEAIARHWNEERPRYDGLFRRPDSPSKTYMLLRPEFWRGQQQGGKQDAVHTRHMRPRCDIISTDPELLEESPKNLALFMPYLHWETDRKRSIFEGIMDNITMSHKRKEKERARKKMSTPVRVQTIRGQPDPAHNPPQFASSTSMAYTTQHSTNPRDNKNFGMMSTAVEVMSAKFSHEMKEHPDSKFSKTGVAKQITSGPLRPVTLLGRVLYRAARLYEAMDNYQEQELLKEYLHYDPPFHPRRTLDQSHFWTQKTTKKRDRDQVVYRATTAREEFRHDSAHVMSECEECLANIRKVPRVVMVDQLWLWILNGNTIITSFPKRYGRNRPDPSAVHKRIRLRLKNYRRNEIRSVYDLALIIIDQCSRVFFDRGQLADRLPQMMNIFASAIENVEDKRALAYEHLWDIAHYISNMYKDANRDEFVEEKASYLLDINPEGKLLRETRDILNEIKMMMRIKNKQQDVFRQFRNHVEAIIVPVLAISRGIGTTKPQKVLKSTHDGDFNSLQEVGDKELESSKAERNAKWTLELAHVISVALDDRIAELNNLKESAEDTEMALDGLLALKQQQATVFQARKAVQQTEETLRQGRSIMLFTVITIIFLPLSVGTSIFGMNAVEFNGVGWSVRREMIYIIPISVGIILISILLAFSNSIRVFLAFFFAPASFVLDLAWTWFITSTRLYSLWLHLSSNSQNLNKMRRDWTSEWKENARKDQYARNEWRAEKTRKKKRMAEIKKNITLEV